MRRILLAIALLSTGFASSAAAATCQLDLNRVLATSPFFSTQMTPADRNDGPNTVSRAHIDDPRMVTIFTMTSPRDDVSAISRSAYIRELDERTQNFAIDIRSKGGWAEGSIFPFDPVAWRTVHETTVDGFGLARVTHMEIRLTPDCLLVADSVAPASVNLRSRWTQIHSALASLRDSAAPFVVPETFQPERNVPSGTAAAIGGVVSPLAVVLFLYLMLGQMKNLDPPGVTTRIVLGSSSAIAFGAVFFHRDIHLEGFADAHYADGGPLLGLIGLFALAGALLSQRSALIALLTVIIGGITLGLASYLSWTPDKNVTAVVGAAFVLLGLAGFYAWSDATANARQKRESAARGAVY